MPSEQFCGEKKKRTEMELNFSNSASSQAQTVSTSGNALLLGKPYHLGYHRVKSCMVFSVYFRKSSVAAVLKCKSESVSTVHLLWFSQKRNSVIL